MLVDIAEKEMKSKGDREGNIVRQRKRKRDIERLRETLRD